MDMETIEFIGAIAALYPIILKVLPPKWAKKLAPFGKFFKILADTPGGYKIKK